MTTIEELERRIEILERQIEIPSGFCRVKSKEEIAEMIGQVTEERKQDPEPCKPIDLIGDIRQGVTVPNTQEEAAEYLRSKVKPTPEPRKPRERWVERPYGCVATYAYEDDPKSLDAFEVREILRDSNGNEIESDEVRQLRSDLDARDRNIAALCEDNTSLRLEIGRVHLGMKQLTADLAAERAAVADVVAERDRLTADNESLKKSVARMSKLHDEMNGERYDAHAEVKRLTAERDRLRVQMNEQASIICNRTLENDRVVAENQDLRATLGDVVAERDRLRAIIDAHICVSSDDADEIEKLASELADFKARHETSLEVIRSREQEAERQRVAVDRLTAERDAAKRQLAIAVEFTQAMKRGEMSKCGRDNEVGSFYDVIGDWVVYQIACATRCLELIAADAAREGK